jgi:hypothetical protein
MVAMAKARKEHQQSNAHAFFMLMCFRQSSSFFALGGVVQPASMRISDKRKTCIKHYSWWRDSMLCLRGQYAQIPNVAAPKDAVIGLGINDL